MPEQTKLTLIEGLRVYSLAASLVHCAKTTFAHQPIQMRTLLSMVTGNWDAFQQVKLAVEKVLQGAIRGLIPALFDLLMEEENPAVLVVLGHFIFIYIHSYFDGDGRMGRFIIIAF
jgi:hypothetical protein